MKTITNVHLIANHFNSYFTEIGPNLTNKIEKSSISFEGYIKKCNNIQPDHPLSINELNDAFFANNSYLLMPKTQILQILPVEFPKDQYLGLSCSYYM